MADQQGLRNAGWDSGSSVKLYFGARPTPILKATPPKATVKTDRPHEVGAMLATVQTPGVGEVSDGSVELLTTRWEELLTRMPVHGITLAVFNITVMASSPIVRSRYGQLWEGCRFVEFDGPPLEASEKALTTKRGISCINIWERGRDGVWKSLFLLDDQPMSKAANALTKLF